MTDQQFAQLKESVIARLRQELPEHLTYHTPEHVLYVLDAADRIAAYEGVNSGDLTLLRVAVLYHDLGFVNSVLNHELESCTLAREELPDYGLSAAEIEAVCGMIMATRIPQVANNLLERIIADADLEYLGTDRFEEMADGLYRELKYASPGLTVERWNKIQVRFLEEHRYLTEYCKTFRQDKKEEHLRELRHLLGQDTSPEDSGG